MARQQEFTVAPVQSEDPKPQKKPEDKVADAPEDAKKDKDGKKEGEDLVCQPLTHRLTHLTHSV